METQLVKNCDVFNFSSMFFNIFNSVSTACYFKFTNSNEGALTQRESLKYQD